MTEIIQFERELAEGLRDAEMRGDMDAIIGYQNEICDRLDIPGDWTEQGLTPEASDAIRAFCEAQGVS